MSNADIAITREEFVRILSERVKEPTDIAKHLRDVEAIMTVFDIGHNPVYIIEINQNAHPADIAWMYNTLTQANIPACLVPAKMMNYVGYVTDESLGIVDKIKAMKRRMIEFFERESDE